MRVRRAEIGDESAIRAVRLRMLGDEPEWFGSTVERELGRTTEDWRRWLAPGATVLAEDDRGDPVGIVAVVRPDDEPEVAQLISMWVAPDARGAGVVDQLIQAALACSADGGATTARLHVYDTNDRAMRVYRRSGFATTGDVLPADGLGRVQAEMTRPLGAATALASPASAVRIEKVKRPGGVFAYEAVDAGLDEHGAWLFVPHGAAWWGPDDRGVIPFDCLVLVTADRWFVTWWVADPADHRVEIDVSRAPERTATGWRYIDLELDPIRHEPDRVEIEDVAELAERLADGSLDDAEAAAAERVAAEMHDALVTRREPWGDDGWRRLEAQRQPR